MQLSPRLICKNESRQYGNITDAQKDGQVVWEAIKGWKIQIENKKKKKKITFFNPDRKRERVSFFFFFFFFPPVKSMYTIKSALTINLHLEISPTVQTRRWNKATLPITYVAEELVSVEKRPNPKGMTYRADTQQCKLVFCSWPRRNCASSYSVRNVATPLSMWCSRQRRVRTKN